MEAMEKLVDFGVFEPKQDETARYRNLQIVGLFNAATATLAFFAPPESILVQGMPIPTIFFAIIIVLFVSGTVSGQIALLVIENPARYRAAAKAAMHISHLGLTFSLAINWLKFSVDP